MTSIARTYAIGINEGLLDGEQYYDPSTDLDTGAFIEQTIGWANAHCDIEDPIVSSYCRAYLAAMDAVFNAKQATMCRDAGISLKPFIYS